MSSDTASKRLSSISKHLSSNMSSFDAFESIQQAPPDSIFELTRRYKEDTFKQKVNLGVGAYRDNDGKPFVLPVVAKAKQIIAADNTLDHEYLPITGLPDFTTGAAKLLFKADSPAIKEKRTSTVQTISGTGANHLAALFLDRHYTPWQEKGQQADKVIYISNPSWANHQQIMTTVGLKPTSYPYYNPKTIGLDFDGFLNAVQQAPDSSVFLLHACAHNPTGVDPTKQQWQQLADAFISKKHFAFFDCAYQGFASGDLDGDAWAVRHFVDRRIPLLVCQSFAKNAGLYGERVGTLTVVAANEKEAQAVFSQLSVLQRSEISNPPTFGARIMNLILNDQKLFDQWVSDVKGMANRIIDMRQQLFDLLTQKHKTPGNWEHITSQIGMFSFTGLKPDQVKAMVENGHVYMTGNGRISMAGLNSRNVGYVAECIDKAVRGQL